MATYGLRRAVRDADTDVVRPTPVEVIDPIMVRRTQKALDEEGKIRLHKIVSNVQEVLDAFPPDDLGKDIKDFSIGDEDNLVQNSLGLTWTSSSTSQILMSPLLDEESSPMSIVSLTP